MPPASRPHRLHRRTAGGAADANAIRLRLHIHRALGTEAAVPTELPPVGEQVFARGRRNAGTARIAPARNSRRRIPPA